MKPSCGWRNGSIASVARERQSPGGLGEIHNLPKICKWRSTFQGGGYRLLLWLGCFSCKHGLWGLIGRLCSLLLLLRSIAMLRCYSRYRGQRGGRCPQY